MGEDSRGIELSNVIRIGDERVREHLGRRGPQRVVAGGDLGQCGGLPAGKAQRVVGAFPAGNSGLNLAAARHIAGPRWSTE